MPKKKKTRQQKIIADHRREEVNTSLYSFTPESLTSQSKQHLKPVKKSIAITTSSYQYLTRDLSKTALFTAAIVLIELTLRSIIK
ncbi:hypothetical protein HZA75_00345 [Candidatus Roizmanbacteria bacterium]|nr:hypothetical protein [Candidatus Roizmanbacteria bacterium]